MLDVAPDGARRRRPAWFYKYLAPYEAESRHSSKNRMMPTTDRTRKRLGQVYFRLIRTIGVIVPRRLRTNWRREWEAELEYRESLLANWDRLNRRTKLVLFIRSLGAFWDALWLQQLRWED